MFDHLDIPRTATSGGAAGEQPTSTLIQQTAFIRRATPVQATPGEPNQLNSPRENLGPNVAVPSYPYDPDMDDVREGVQRLNKWDQDGIAEDRREMEQRRRAQKPEPSAAELLQQAQKLFNNPADRAAAMTKFQEAIKKSDAEGDVLMQYVKNQLQFLPPFDERDPQVSQQLLNLVEQGVDGRVDTRWAFAEALEKTGDHASAEAIRKDALDIFFSMIGPEVHAEQREQRWKEYEQQQVPPRQFDISARPY